MQARLRPIRGKYRKFKNIYRRLLSGTEPMSKTVYTTGGIIMQSAMKELGYKGKEFTVGRVRGTDRLDWFVLVWTSNVDVRQIIFHEANGYICIGHISAWYPALEHAVTSYGIGHKVLKNTRGVLAEKVSIKNPEVEVELAQPDAMQNLCAALRNALRAPPYEYSQTVVL